MTRILLLAVVAAVVVLCGGATVAQAAQARAIYASSFTPVNCAYIADWSWMRSGGAKATWTFNTTPLVNARSGSAYLNFAGLVTNGVNGGAGYDVTLKFFNGSVTVAAKNPFRPISPNNSGGLGYGVYGHSGALGTSVLKQLRVGTISITLAYPNWSPVGYHVGVRQESLFIGYLQ